MLLVLASVIAAGCQGCTPAQAASAATVRGAAADVDYRLIDTGEEQKSATIRAASNFSFSQAQTSSTSEIAIAPVIGVRTTRSIGVDASRPPSVNSLRISNSAGIVGYQGRRSAENLTRPVRQVSDFDAEVAISAPMERTGLGFDVGVVPRVSLSRDGDFEQRSVGGEIRIGQNFDQRGQNVAPDSWYLFAGADGEALVYEPDGDRNFTNRMALRDQVTVGDMQAGVSFTRGNGQLSLSYIHREVEYNERGLQGQRAAEDFAGVSFTLRR